MGALYALASGLLFGGATPAAKVLLHDASPLQTAGLLYVGCGAGLGAVLLARRALAGAAGAAVPGPIAKQDRARLAMAIACGGLLGPVLLMTGLAASPASTVSLLLNLEAVFTALLAWAFFGENTDRRALLAMGLIVGGGAGLSLTGGGGRIPLLGIASVVLACVCWAADNNITQTISGNDPIRMAAIKGGVAGSANLALAAALGAALPSRGAILGALLTGALGYGASLALFVRALRDIGAARTTAFFSIAPFVGAGASVVVLRESAGPALVVSGLLMAVGALLLLTETHEHEHRHERMTHSHRHVHDLHHQHEHPQGIDPVEPHTHEHVHEPLVHTHPHAPDLHHRHHGPHSA